MLGKPLARVAAHPYFASVESVAASRPASSLSSSPSCLPSESTRTRQPCTATPSTLPRTRNASAPTRALRLVPAPALTVRLGTTVRFLPPLPKPSEVRESDLGRSKVIPVVIMASSSVACRFRRGAGLHALNSVLPSRPSWTPAQLSTEAPPTTTFVVTGEASVLMEALQFQVSPGRSWTIALGTGQTGAPSLRMS